VTTTIATITSVIYITVLALYIVICYCVFNINPAVSFTTCY